MNTGVRKRKKNDISLFIVRTQTGGKGGGGRRKQVKTKFEKKKLFADYVNWGKLLTNAVPGLSLVRYIAQLTPRFCSPGVGGDAAMR